MAANPSRVCLTRRLVQVALPISLALAPTGADADAMVGAVDDFTLLHSWQGNTEFLGCGTCSFPPFLCLCPPPSQQQGAATQLGGPGGALDVYLRVSDLPSYGLETWNRADDRTGDYLTAGIGRVELDLRNFGPGEIALRLGIERGATRWVTSDDEAIFVPGAGGWLIGDFLLTDAHMTRVAGTDSLAFVLSDVQEIRLIHALSPQWSGDGGAAFGVDNVLLPEIGRFRSILSGAGLLGLLAARRNRR